MPSRRRTIQVLDRISLPPGGGQDVTTTPEGFLAVSGLPIARIGVQLYELDDGSIRRDLRLPEHVFSSAALASGEGKVITDDHPTTPVTVDNATEVARGSMRNLRPDHARGLVLADITITDKAAIERVQAGKRDLSVGYRTTLIPIEGGQHVGEDAFAAVQADVLQTDIQINHLAIVDEGRANEGRADRPARIQLDSAGSTVARGVSASRGTTKHKRRRMEEVEIVIDGVTYKVPERVADHLKGLEATKVAAGVQQARADKLEGRVAGLEAQLKDKDKDQTEAKERLAWASAAAAYAPLLDCEPADLVDKTPAEICLAAAMKRYPSMNLKDRGPEFVEGLLLADGLKSEAATQDPIGDAARSKAPENTEDASPLIAAMRKRAGQAQEDNK